MIRATSRATKWIIAASVTLFVLVGVIAVFIPAERKFYLNARIAGLLENLSRRTGDVSVGDLAGYELQMTMQDVTPDDVPVETINRMADLVLSSDSAIREYAARVLGDLGPSAKRSERAVPALRRAIAEQLAALRGYDGNSFVSVVVVYNAQLASLSSITGVPFEELKDHPEQFEQLTPNMEACHLVNSAEHCDQLLVEWRAEHP